MCIKTNLFYICPFFRPSKIFFVAFFSVTVDGRNLIFSHKRHIGRGKTVYPPPPSGSRGIKMYVVGKGETVPSYTMKGTKNVNVQI
jgi:hypothetical protein